VKLPVVPHGASWRRRLEQEKRLHPVFEDKVGREGIQEPHSLQNAAMGKAFTQDEGHLVEASGRPDLGVVIGKLVIADAATC
jgi:hypothetical protein